MSIKMAELMKETGETKSTILYYVKEGLLQEPSKPKPNVHLYAGDSIDRISLIKILQNQLHYSITQIKQVFDANDFDFSDGINSLVQRLDIFMGVKEKNYKSLDEAIAVYGFDKKLILSYVESGLLEMNNNYFSDNSWKILQVLKDISTCRKSKDLLQAYLKSAKELAVLEYELGIELINQDETNRAQELFLDMVLSLKPYIFNLQTKQEHKRRTDG